MARIRNKEIKRRRQRRERIGNLKKKLAAAKNESERNHLIELIKRRDPYFIPPKK
jgi:hypothetical protein